MPTPPSKSSRHPPPAPFRWLRDGHVRNRPASQGDRTVLAELAAGSGHTTARLPVPEAGSDVTPWQSARSVRLVERDRRIVAGLAWRPGAPTLDLGPHPWSRLPSPENPPFAPAAPSEMLWITGLVYRPPEETDRLPAAWLQTTAHRICQRAGARRIAAFVPTRPPTDGSDWTPRAYVQQLYFGALDDPDVSPFLAADFVPRGLAAPGDFPFDNWRALMVWENARR